MLVVSIEIVFEAKSNQVSRIHGTTSFSPLVNISDPNVGPFRQTAWDRFWQFRDSQKKQNINTHTTNHKLSNFEFWPFFLVPSVQTSELTGCVSQSKKHPGFPKMQKCKKKNQRSSISRKKKKNWDVPDWNRIRSVLCTNIKSNGHCSREEGEYTKLVRARIQKYKFSATKFHYR